MVSRDASFSRLPVMRSPVSPRTPGASRSVPTSSTSGGPRDGSVVGVPVAVLVRRLLMRGGAVPGAVVLVHDGMSLAAADEPAIDRHGDDEGDGEGTGEGSPEPRA